MANIGKVSRYKVKGTFAHCNRKQGDGINRSNMEIDYERTFLNYYLKEGSMSTFKDKMKDVYVSTDRNDIVYLYETLVTLPKDCKEEDERKFFEAVYGFFCKDFGEEKIVNAVVHKDETTPHIHIHSIPIVYPDNPRLSESTKQKFDRENASGKHYTGILNAKACLSRDYFKDLHNRLSDYVEKALGYKVEILNGATANGNKTIDELKAETRQKEIEEKEKQIQMLDEKLSTVDKQLDKLHINKEYFSIQNVLNQMEALKEENDLYREVLISNRIPLPKDKIQKIQDLKADVSSSNVVIKQGEFEPTKEWLLFETFKENKRELPLDDLIEDDPELNLVVNRLKPKTVYYRELSRGNCIFVPTDNIFDTVKAMYYIRDELVKTVKANTGKDIKSISMVQFSNDRDNLAKNILTDIQMQVEYFLLEQSKLLDEEKARFETITNDTRSNTDVGR